MPLDPTLPLGRTLGKEDKAYVAAQDRLDATLTSFQAMGAEASGEVGHKDPVEAARDAMRGHPVDEVILSTLPSGSRAGSVRTRRRA